ncbi:MAG: hypothetical protein WBO44_11950 [Saprospiraceae bacterium]
MPYKPKKKNSNLTAQHQLQLAIDFEKNVEEFQKQDQPTGRVREHAKEKLTSYIKLKSVINTDVIYDISSLGIAIIDPIALSNIQSDLKKTILNPVLIIEVNHLKHTYFRGNPSMFQIATVVYKDEIWFIDNFIFNSPLELAQSKFKEGKIIYTKAK